MTNKYLTTEELCGFAEKGYEDELWSIMPGYYSNYYFSTKGRVWNSTYRRFIKPQLNSHGYQTVRLSLNGWGKTVEIHRIEALIFKDNPYCLPVVRHLDDNPLNNDINNLEWGTYSDNFEDAKRNGHWNDRLRPIIVINNDTGIGYYYRSCIEASKDLGYAYSAFSRGLTEGLNVGGYRLEDAKEEYLHDGIQNGDPVKHLFPTQKMPQRPKQSTKVLCTRCSDGEPLIFNNIIEVVKFFDSPYKTIMNAIYTKAKHKGYYIEYIY